MLSLVIGVLIGYWGFRAVCDGVLHWFKDRKAHGWGAALAYVALLVLSWFLFAFVCSMLMVFFRDAQGYVVLTSFAMLLCNGVLGAAELSSSAHRAEESEAAFFARWRRKCYFHFLALSVTLLLALGGLVFSLATREAWVDWLDFLLNWSRGEEPLLELGTYGWMGLWLVLAAQMFVLFNLNSRAGIVYLLLALLFPVLGHTVAYVALVRVGRRAEWLPPPIAAGLAAEEVVTGVE